MSKLKEIRDRSLGIVAILAIFAIPVLFLVGAEWLSARLLPWFTLASALALVFAVCVLLPLSFFRPWREFAAIGSLVVSFVFGTTLWMWTLLLTLELCGAWAIGVGLFMMGIGFVPIAMLATLFNGMWSTVAQLLVLVALTFGTRWYALWIAARAE